MKNFALIGLVLFTSLSANAWMDKCSTRRDGPVQSICQGRTIPASKARNFHRNSHELVCAPGVDHYFRMPQKYNFAAWNDLLKQNQEQKAQDMRKTQKDITWSGTIPYRTVEKWTWESCDLVTSFECGSRTETRIVTRYRDVCSGSGETRQCRSESYEVEEQYEVPETCYLDVNRYEEWDCSREEMTFNAKFNRPDYSQWKPGAPNYIDAIPNKYDLLPGEVEDVQIFSNGASRSVLSPTVEVGDAWNKYDFSISGSGSGAQCRQNQALHINVEVDTIERNKDKKTPNAFKLPTDHEGRSLSPFIWENKEDVNGGYIKEGVPTKLRLADSSSGLIKALSEQSRKTADREEKKQAQGQGKTPDAMEDDAESKAGFFKNTKVRVRLVKENKVLFNTSSTEHVIYDQSEGIVPSLNVISKNQDIAFSDLWEIDLRKDGTYGVYETRWLGRDRHLRPGQAYFMEVSVYQKGVKGLYLQDCEEEYTFWGCSFRWMGLGRTESNIFSDPLNVPFNTNEQMKDERGLFDKFMDLVK